MLGEDGIRCALNRLLGTLISAMDSLEVDSGVRFHFRGFPVYTKTVKPLVSQIPFCFYFLSSRVAFIFSFHGVKREAWLERICRSKRIYI